MSTPWPRLTATCSTGTAMTCATYFSSSPWRWRSEYWVCVSYAIFEIDGVLWLCAVHNTTMLMGLRKPARLRAALPMSGWRRGASSLTLTYVPSWLEIKSAAFCQVYAERLSAFGVGEARGPTWRRSTRTMTTCSSLAWRCCSRASPSGRACATAPLSGGRQRPS